MSAVPFLLVSTVEEPWQEENTYIDTGTDTHTQTHTPF